MQLPGLNRLVVAVVVLGIGMSLIGSATLAGDRAKQGTIFVEEVKVKTTNVKGESWDVNDGKPDIRVRMKNLTIKDSKEFASVTSDDTFHAVFNAPTLAVEVGQTVEIIVEDVDVAVNDEIGRTTMVVTQAIIDAGSHDVAFGQVLSFKLKFQVAKSK